MRTESRFVRLADRLPDRLPPWVRPSPAPATRGPLRYQDLFELESASAPQISPDGKRIVYVRGFADVLSDEYYSNLWIVNADGSGHRPLTTGKRNDVEPRWSPSGDRLAWISTADGSSQIWVRYMDDGAGGAREAEISHHEHAPSGLSWSPDGTRLAFSALVPQPPRVIGESFQAPEGAEWAPPAKVIDRMRYRYDPVGYLPRGDWHLFVLPAEGGTARQVTEGAGAWGAPGLGGGGSAVWGPEGSSLLMSANLRPESDLEPLDTEVYEIPLDGSEPQALTSRPGPDNSVAVSPDGTRIAYVGFDDRSQGYQLTRLYVADRDGGNARVVASTRRALGGRATLGRRLRACLLPVRVGGRGLPGGDRPLRSLRDPRRRRRRQLLCLRQAE